MLKQLAIGTCAAAAALLVAAATAGAGAQPVPPLIPHESTCDGVATTLTLPPGGGAATFWIGDRHYVTAAARNAWLNQNVTAPTTGWTPWATLGVKAGLDGPTIHCTGFFDLTGSRSLPDPGTPYLWVDSVDVLVR
jgi:hypothetical protein